mgnify:CR=1 FL=1
MKSELSEYCKQLSPNKTKRTEKITKIIIHHMNPITVQDIRHANEDLLDPEFLICVRHNTHNAIHYGDESLLITEPIVRMPNDTCPWRH